MKFIKVPAFHVSNLLKFESKSTKFQLVKNFQFISLLE